MRVTKTNSVLDIPVFKAALLVALGWSLGLFIGDLFRFLMTNFAVNPLLRLLSGN